MPIGDRDKVLNGEKVEASYYTVTDTLEPIEFQDHLTGRIGLSIVLNCLGPNAEAGDYNRDHCNRAAVDIDHYTETPEERNKLAADVAATLEALGIPVLMTISKSGGVHAHVFFAELTPASLANNLMKRLRQHIAQALGLAVDKIDAFPKQELVDYDMNANPLGNKGNGLNLCYNGTNRLGWSPDGPLPADVFFQRCKAARLDAQAVQKLDQALPQLTRDTRRPTAQETAADAKLNQPGTALYEGPPCLQKIVGAGVLEHNRNNFLYSLGVFYKRAGMASDAASLDEMLKADNNRLCRPSLSDKEVKPIAKSVWKTENAFYKCKEDPICGVCNKELCKTRQFGIGQSDIPYYDDVVELMVQRFHVVDRGGEPVVMHSKVRPSRFHTRREWETQTFTQFKNLLINETVWVMQGQKMVEAQLADTYLKDRNRKTFAGVVLDPENEWPDHLNLWQGFAVEPNPGDWSLFEDHVREVICAGDQELFDYVLGWMAWKIQNPCSVPGVALVLRGGRGVGKNTFFENYGKLFGQHFYMTAHGDQVMGRFNDHLMDCCLLGADEAFWAGDKRHEGVLKAMITGEQLGFEGKGRKAIQADNHLGVIVSSNNDYVVPAGLDERRFCVMDVSEKHKQDDAYFKPLREQMNAGGREAMLHDLKAMDLSAFNIRKVPQTKALADQKLEAAPTFLKWLVDVLTLGEIEWPYKSSAGTRTESWTRGATFEINKPHFFAAYREWCKHNTRKGGTETGQKLGKDVGKYLFPKKTVKQKRKGQSGDYIYCLPPLEEARKLIEAAIGGSIDWGDTDAEVIPFERGAEAQKETHDPILDDMFSDDVTDQISKARH
ncbi:DUF5906 domain-containing protein [Paracoccus ravus]|uniref:DUF5906 domain-containing protein n=1 Tax=Paracoccus ravus TaxID=2447760 RepID=UPI00106E7C45|nr:DUF5906 domain-containing protein [Paracoccus ravus]